MRQNTSNNRPVAMRQRCRGHPKQPLCDQGIRSHTLFQCKDLWLRMTGSSTFDQRCATGHVTWARSLPWLTSHAWTWSWHELATPIKIPRDYNSRKVEFATGICRMRVAGCELRVASCGLRVASCKELRVATCGFGLADQDLRITDASRLHPTACNLE